MAPHQAVAHPVANRVVKLADDRHTVRAERKRVAGVGEGRS
jgi:hypothetical protein